MIDFEVNDMSCGHCVSSITQAIQAVDQGARVEVDLARHRVRIASAQADVQQLREAIEGAGYTPVPAAPAV